MSRMKIIGTVLIVIGAICLFFSNSIAERVAAGRMQIAQGQRSVNEVNTVFSQSQYTKPLGNMITESAEKKINAGRAEADQYAALSNQLRVGGIILIVVGAGFFFFDKRKKHN